MHDASGRSNHALERWPLRSVLAVQRDRLRDMLARRPFLKNVSIMLTGSAVGQLASVRLSPMLTRIYQGVTGALSQIGLGLLGAGAAGLLIGSILGQSAGTLGLFYGQIKSRRALLRTISWKSMAVLARRYRRFPLVSSWAALVDAVGGNQLLYLLVSVQYSARIAGFIFLAE